MALADQNIAQLFTDAFEAGKLSMAPERRAAMIEDPETKRYVPLVIDEDGNGGVHVIVGEQIAAYLEKTADKPARAKGTATLLDLASFCDHVNRFKSSASVIYADVSAFSLTAVYNEAIDRLNPAWRDHRSVYTCPRSPQWLVWTSRDGRAQEQEEFADFIEANLADLSSVKGYPTPVEVLQVARDLTVLTKGTFQRQINPTTGAGILVCKTETETGSTEIPRAFALAIPVFDGGAPYHVEARVRFTLANGKPTFAYQLHRRIEIERDAFYDARKSVEQSTGLPVWAGKA